MFFPYIYYSLGGVAIFLLLNMIAFRRSYPEKKGWYWFKCWWYDNFLFVLAGLLFVFIMTHLINVELDASVNLFGWDVGEKGVCFFMGLAVEGVMNLARRVFLPIKTN